MPDNTIFDWDGEIEFRRTLPNGDVEIGTIRLVDTPVSQEEAEILREIAFEARVFLDTNGYVGGDILRLRRALSKLWPPTRKQNA